MLRTFLYFVHSVTWFGSFVVHSWQIFKLHTKIQKCSKAHTAHHIVATCCQTVKLLKDTKMHIKLTKPDHLHFNAVQFELTHLFRNSFSIFLPFQFVHRSYLSQILNLVHFFFPSFSHSFIRNAFPTRKLEIGTFFKYIKFAKSEKVFV